MALHVNPGFDPDNHAPLTAWCADHGMPLHAEATDHGPRAHSDENRKRSACFYCAMLRRNRLFDLCRHYGLTHLAMGHNADDLAVTFFMNIFQTGKVSGLSPDEAFFGGALRMIRPAAGGGENAHPPGRQAMGPACLAEHLPLGRPHAQGRLFRLAERDVRQRQALSGQRLRGAPPLAA